MWLTIVDIWAVEGKHSSMVTKQSSMVYEQKITSNRDGKSSTYKYGVIYKLYYVNLHAYQFDNKMTFK